MAEGDPMDDGLMLVGDVLERVHDLADARDEAVDAAARAALKIRQLPSDTEAERRLLGGIMLDGTALAVAVDAGLLGRHFFRPAHATLFEAMVSLRSAGRPVDVPTVCDTLQERGQLEAVGGAAAITQLEAMLPTAAHVGSYALRLTHLAARREVLAAAQQAAAAAIGGRDEPEAIIRFAEHQLDRARSATRAKSPWASELQRAHDDLGAAGVKRRRWDRPIGKSALALAEANLPPVPWVVQGIVRERAVAVLGGAPKGGKTWDEAELAIAIATGTHAFGEFAVRESGPVLMICLEDDERDLRTRLLALATGRRIQKDRALRHIYYEARGALDLCSDEDCAGIVASARMLPQMPRLICIDPLRDANSGEENSNDDMRRVMHVVRAIRDVTGAAILLVHHLSKPGQETRVASTSSIFDRFRGAGALRGAWDAGIGKDTRSRTPTCIKSRIEVETRGGRGAGTFGLQLDISDDDHGNAVSAGYAFFRDPKELFDGDGDERPRSPKTQAERKDAARDKLLAYLQRELRADERKDREPRSWSAPHLADAIGLTRPSVLRYLQDLATQGLVITTPRGSRALTAGTEDGT